MTETTAPAHKHQGISRRHIMIGAAWAAPAIVVATAVPQAAASTLETQAFAGTSATTGVQFARTSGENGNNELWALWMPAGIAIQGFSVDVTWTPDGSRGNVSTLGIANPASAYTWNPAGSTYSTSDVEQTDVATVAVPVVSGGSTSVNPEVALDFFKRDRAARLVVTVGGTIGDNAPLEYVEITFTVNAGSGTVNNRTVSITPVP